MVRRNELFLLRIKVFTRLVSEPTPRPKGAWNDPPMLKKKTASNPPVASQKITTPVVGPIQTGKYNCWKVQLENLMT